MAEVAKLQQLLYRKLLDGRPVVISSDVGGTDGDDDLPKPPDLKTVYLGGLLVMALLAACYVAAELVLPVVLACLLKLVLQPVMRALGRLHLPQGVAALLIILVLFGTFAGLGTALSEPAASWAQKLSS